ncbi:MAG TPA: alanine dehydrogenase, partial [bacterium]
MIIGVPKEIKDNEFRVGIVPGGVEELVLARHQVLLEKGAGLGSGIPDSEFVKAGARLVSSKRDLFRRSDMILKVKEPQSSEYSFLHQGQIL